MISVHQVSDRQLQKIFGEKRLLILECICFKACRINAKAYRNTMNVFIRVITRKAFIDYLPPALGN
jgi:hypothetical protein